MPLLRPALLALSVLLALPLAAQEAAGIQSRMSAEERRATGIDKLTEAELAQLNAWLRRHAPDAEALETAREEGRQEVVRKNRGFLDFGSSEPIESRLAGSFRGFGRHQEYVLENGQVWQQVDDATLYGVRGDNLPVTLRPGALGAWWMRVGNHATQAKVKRVR